MDDWTNRVFEIFSGRFYTLEPTTNAGRYLRQLERGENNFQRSGEQIDDELECALRRVAITSRRQQA